MEAKPVSVKSFHKFGTVVSPRLAGYVLLQFAILLVITFLFLKTAGDTPGMTTQNLALTGWIVWTTGSLGGLLEGRNWAWWSELGRWVVAVLGFVLLFHV